MYIVNLYNVRWKKRYTQKEVMLATGLSQKTVSHIFNGKYYNYELKTLETIAKFFNCRNLSINFNWMFISKIVIISTLPIDLIYD